MEAVAEAVMQQGCCDQEGRLVQLIQPFLPGALHSLTDSQNAFRYAGNDHSVGVCLPFVFCSIGQCDAMSAKLYAVKVAVTLSPCKCYAAAMLEQDLWSALVLHR